MRDNNFAKASDLYNEIIRRQEEFGSERTKDFLFVLFDAIHEGINYIEKCDISSSYDIPNNDPNYFLRHRYATNYPNSPITDIPNLIMRDMVIDFCRTLLS